MLATFSVPSWRRGWYSDQPGEFDGDKTRYQSTRAPATSRRAALAARAYGSGSRQDVRGEPQRGQPLGQAVGERWEILAARQTPGAPTGTRCRETSEARAPAQKGRARRRVRHRTLDARARGRGDLPPLRGAIQRDARLALARESGMEPPTTRPPRHRARRGGHSALEAATLAGSKKNAAKQGRVIVFVDESGLSERPTRVRTWAPKGETPVLQYHFNWKQLSVIAGITIYRFYFRLIPGTIKGLQLSEFLAALHKTIGRRLLVIGDGLAAHRSRSVRAYVESRRGAIQLERLPAYAPELNPVEYIWGYLKQHALANFCAHDLAQLSDVARQKLRSLQRRATLVTAFWKQAELAL